MSVGSEVNMIDAKQCKKCIYWKIFGSHSGGQKACHHLLVEKRKVERVDGVCLSRSTAKKAPERKLRGKTWAF